MPNRSRTSVPLASLARTTNSTPNSAPPAAHLLKSRTHIAPINGRMTVACDVENFIASGLTIEGLLGRLRSELVAAAHAAVYVDPAVRESTHTVSVDIDLDVPEPWLFFTILDPRRFLDELDVQERSIQKLVSRFLATNRPSLVAGGHHA